MKSETKIFRARNDYFQLNNFGNEYVREFEGKLISFKENVHICNFPTGNIVTLKTKSGIVELVLPLRKTAIKSFEIIKQKATVGCTIRLKTVKGKTSNPQIWIDGKKLSENKIPDDKIPEIESFRTEYPDLFNALSTETKKLIIENKVDILTIVKENEKLLLQFSNNAKTTLLSALVQNSIAQK